VGDFNFRCRLDDLRDEFPDYEFNVVRPAHVVIEISRFGAVVAKSAESSESDALAWAREVCATLPRIPAPSQSHDECRSRVRAFLRRRVLDVDHASHTITLESADIEAGDVLIVVSPAKRGH